MFTMKSIPWCRSTKIVAVVELVIRVLSICLLLYGLVLAWQAERYNYDPFSSWKHFFDYFRIHFSSGPFWVRLAMIIVSLVQCWAAVRLWQATSLETDMEAAFDKAKNFRRINLTIIFLYMILFFCNVNYKIVAAHMIILGIFVWIVSKYMQQLRIHLGPIPR